jgi:antirestriction protein ArdC
MKREKKGTPTLLSEAILKLMKTVGSDWQKPWRNKRFITCNDHYLSGNNVVVLASLSDFERTVWGTYDQWSYHGCQVQKGAKAVKLTVYKGKDENNKLSFGKYIAFNIEQCDGDTHKFDGFDKTDVNEDSYSKEADAMLSKLGSIIQSHGTKAAYSPSKDVIYMPGFESFESAAAYYGTRCHEEGHRTGHTSRLNRELKGKFGDEKYAMEELIAELTSCFMCVELGVISEPRNDHAQYLNSWIKLLENDKRAFSIAVGKAQQATNYMLEQMGREIQEVA